MNRIFKKIITIVLTISVLTSICAIPAYAAEQNSEKEYVLCKSNGEVKQFIMADDTAGKLNYMDEDASYPLNTVISYKLNNKTLSPEEITGVNGNIAIDIEYQGNKSNYKAITFLLLDKKHFSDINVEPGKIISDGDKSIIIGITSVPGTLHIEANSSDFEIKAIYALVTDSLSGEIDIEDLAPIFGIDISGIKETIKELQSVNSMNSSENMSLSEGIDELTNGMNQLSDGLTTLDNNSAQLVNGSKRVFQSLIDMANEELTASDANIPTLTISNYNKVLSNAINQVSPEGITKTAKATVESKVYESEPIIRAGVEQAVQTEVTRQVTEQIKATLGVTDTNNPMIQEKITAAVQEQMASEAVKNTIDEKTEEKIASLVEENMNSPEVQKQLAVGIAKGNAGAPALIELKAQLDSYNKFYKGLQQYTEGVSKAAEGAATINSATSIMTGKTTDFLNDNTLGLINDAGELLEKAESETSSVKYIIKFDSIRH